ncbi:uncharacterized protein TRIADDRAFT_56437 [Trichoplax adhaerens]|uniref:C2 domain-containing protein n=1 Tax=Trichoplax adhaerens TaxID=10228 RepID=B3RY48_TRIAD|nr:hypothetical protein TRIADDRAFT_56437 [Trichoplax adhaerens]EDV24537.1 hypothetical protein TRIADDRAFT_56437 [Trichoplax adhaerens]|eukprot:XP_002112427.1 hypothetical protein TRIADDRAFT_56437 [Trichoplax adhaerens]
MLSKFLKRIDSYAEDKDEIQDEGKIEDMNESEEVNGIMYNGEDENDNESNNEINNDSRTWQKQDGNLDDLITRSTSFSHNKNDYIRDSFREKSKPLTSARSRRGQMMSKQRVSSTNDSVFSDSFASMDSNCSTRFCRDESSEGFYSSIDHDGKCDSPHSHALPSNGGAIKRIASAGERSDLSSFKANRHSFAASSLKNRTDLRRKALLRERYHEGNFSCDDTESPMGSFDSDYAVESRDEDATTTQNVLLRNKNVVVSQMLEDATGVFQKVSIRRNERLENIKEPEFRKSTEKSDEEDIETYFQKYATPQQRRHLQLTRQNSFDSDNGCGIESEEVEIKGEILFGLRYNRKNSTLEIDVDRARDLPVISKKHKCNAYIKTYFVPETGKNSKRRTTVKKGTTNPQYNETLKYKISSDDEISKKILVISIWHQDKYVPKKQFLGENSIAFSQKHRGQEKLLLALRAKLYLKIALYAYRSDMMLLHSILH